MRLGVAHPVLGGGVAAVLALLLVTFLLNPLATNDLPVFVCAY